jgi:membrane AbrB-like protein
MKQLFTLLFAALCGYLAQLAHIPLPWILGPMFGVGALTFAGVAAKQPPIGRRIGQITIGVALGLYFTQTVIAELSKFASWMLLGCAFSLGLTILFARFFQRFARVDAMTATYACAIGAASDMAVQAQRVGADGASVATSHAVRVMIVVTVIPFIAAAFPPEPFNAISSVNAISPIPEGSQRADDISAFPLMAIVLVSVALATLLSKTRMPNPWVLVPLFTAAAYAGAGNETRLHDLIVNAGSILIGWNLGQYMSREFFRGSPGVLGAAALMTLGMLALSLGFAFVIEWALSISLISAIVATSPGGIAEMAITAKVLGLGAPIVTAFHLTRMVAVILLIRAAGGWMVHTGWLTSRNDNLQSVRQLE